MTQLKPGDIVRLKSGGPPMTVAGRAPSGNYLCCWFAGNEVKTDTFDPDCLCKLKRRRIDDDEWEESEPA